MCPYFCSCVILREITRCPPKNPYFLSAQKFVKRPYCRLVYFNRLSSSFYIQEPIPHTERTKSDDLKSGRDSNPWPFGSFPPNEVPTLPPDLPEKLMVTFTIFDLSLSLPFFHFFWEISSYSTVNLVLNQTILSFKAKKLLTTYLSPLIFLNHKKQTHKLNPQKTTRAGDWIRTNVTFRFLITNQVQSTSMRHQPVAEYFF